MITIKNNVIKKQTKFWNHALFHPTDAIEDSWGKRILDRMAEDGAIKTIRLYTMFEDIVYCDEDGKLCYDFRVNDLRLDYLLEKGYDILLAYAAVPDCIAASTAVKNSVSKNKSRYKGKMFNTSQPKDIALWEEVCYVYTRHLVERYGEDTVSQWYCHCFNEPDIPAFFLGDLPKEDWETRSREYCKMYDAFASGVRRASKGIKIGGPALAHNLNFLNAFLSHIRKNRTEINYIALHNYGTNYKYLNDGSRRLAVENQLTKYDNYMDVIRQNGFDGIEIVLDEWGAAAQGFFNIEECPSYIFREHEVYSAYFAKLIYKLIEARYNISKMMICLSGQHEMTEDFSGFRNFFTLNFITKPIYNAYILASKLHEDLLTAENGNQNIFVIPTKNDKGEYAVLLSYSSDHFEEDLPEIEETLCFPKEAADKIVTVLCIDKNTTNPYRLYRKMGIKTPTDDELKILREEGRLKPIRIQEAREPLKLRLTSNCTYLITVHE